MHVEICGNARERAKMLENVFEYAEKFEMRLKCESTIAMIALLASESLGLHPLSGNQDQDQGRTAFASWSIVIHPIIAGTFNRNADICV